MFFYNKERIKKTAEKKVAAGQMDKAAELYNRILVREPDDKDVLCILGELRIKQGQRRDGLGFLKTAGDLFNQAGEKQKAVSVYRKFLRHEPEDIDVLSGLADLLAQTGHQRQAIETWQGIGRILEGKDLAKAIYYYEKARKMAPRDVETVAALAELYGKQKLLPKAQELNFLAGKQFFEMGDYARSYLHLYEFIQHEPDNRDANMMILKTLLKLESYEDALVHLNAMTQRNNEGDPELLQFRADILFELDKVDELKAVMNKLVILMDGGFEVLFRYIDLAMSRRRYDLAVDLMDYLDMSQYHGFGERMHMVLNNILSEDENHIGALQKLVEFKVYVGDIQGAIPLYSRLYSIYIREDRLQKAYHLLEKWMNLDDSNDWIRREMRRLKLALEEASANHSDLIRGKIEDIGLADVIQMLESARKTGTLQLRFADRTGNIYFRNGSIQQAMFQGHLGQTAIVELFRLSGGDFKFEPTIPETIAPGFEGSNTQIVLDALRVIDEENHRRREDQS